MSRRQIEVGSKSFAKAAGLFDPKTRDSVHMLYAWCRHCDDVIDDQVAGFNTGGQIATPDDLEARVHHLREQTIRAYAGDPDEPPFHALYRVAATHQIPQSYPLDLIDGFAMDAAGRSYETIEDTLSYCYHVAGAVGVMMAMVMGAREQAVLQRACDLGIAFQLTNISRDVIADADVGRVYLPSEWLADAGLSADPEQLGAAEHREAVFAVVVRLLDLADLFYESARFGIARLPFRSACAVAAARRIYRAIGADVRARGPAAWDVRPKTSAGQKLAGLGLGLADAAHAVSFGRLRGDPPSRAGLWTPTGLQI
ncbi:MAG: phytoene/squalene synthase family protein [Hyphomicrobiaceae bacterium]|nr:phytoene/squalene synthase family protein [Hyphomicrobiaceae bacterium]